MEESFKGIGPAKLQNGRSYRGQLQLNENQLIDIITRNWLLKMLHWNLCIFKFLLSLSNRILSLGGEGRDL